MSDVTSPDPTELEAGPPSGGDGPSASARPSLRLIARRVTDLQPRVDASVELFRTHPRLGWRQSGETAQLVDVLLGLANDALEAAGTPAEREALHALAQHEAKLLDRLRDEADRAARTGHDAPWRRIELGSVRASLGEVLQPTACQPPSSPRRIMTADERDRLVRRMTRELVRTMRSVPAPGIDPLSRRDWALIGLVAVLFCLAFLGIVLLEGPR